MGKSPVEDQIAAIDQLIREHPDIRPSLEFHKMIQKAQKRLRESPGKGTNLDWNDPSLINALQQKARRSNKPIVGFLNSSIFDYDVLLHTCGRVADVLVENGVGAEWLDEFREEMRCGKAKMLDAIGAVLEGDAESFENYGKKFKADPALILFIVSSLLQPCLEEIAKNVDSPFLGGWWQAQCPVCGRTPFVARLKARKRYLVCTFCGAEYLTDLFHCVNCGNVDPPTLKFLAPEDSPAFRVDFCEKCKHYLKVIDEDKLSSPIPKGLEDIMTIYLDFVAESAGLIRV